MLTIRDEFSQTPCSRWHTTSCILKPAVTWGTGEIAVSGRLYDNQVCMCVWYCGVLDLKRKLKKAHQCGSRQNQVGVCQVWKLKSGGGSMPWPLEVAAVVQDRRQMWLMITLEVAPKRWLKNGNSWTSIRWSMGEVVCWLTLDSLMKMAAVWCRHHPYHLGNRPPWCHPLDHRRCHPLQQPWCRHRMLQVGCECVSEWAAVREKCIFHRAVGLCYGLSDRFSVDTNWQVSGLLRMLLLAGYHSQLGKPRVKIAVLWLVS